MSAVLVAAVVAVEATAEAVEAVMACSTWMTAAVRSVPSVVVGAALGALGAALEAGAVAVAGRWHPWTRQRKTTRCWWNGRSGLRRAVGLG